MQTDVKRARVVCLTALILSVIFFVGCLILSKVTGVFVLYALSWQVLAAVVIWAILLVQFYQISLAQQEKLDMAQLQQSTGDTIFESQKNHAELFAVAQNRLKFFEKWFLPIFSILLAAYEIVMGTILVKSLLGRIEIAKTNFLLLGAVLAVSIAFVSFLFSLYAIGLSSQKQWKPLRAGGGYFLASSILFFAAAIGMAFAQFKITIVLSVLEWVVPIVIIVLGIEITLNFIFNIYRPRIQGRYRTSAFDSKLLAVIAAPQNIMHTAASAIDYQFGFKVSQTWFYKIIEQAVVPLLLVSAVVLYLLSCIVIVGPESSAIIERFGSPLDSQGDVRIVESGISFKLPWPFGIAKKFPVKQIQELQIGYVPEDETANSRRPLLWGQEHYKKEYNLLVATENIGTQEEGVVPVSIIRAAIPVQYHVNDLYKYLYNYVDSRKVLESVCYREVVKFSAGARVEPESETGSSEESLLGAGRAQAASKLVKIIQQKADEMSLGVDVVFMGLQGFHPPPEVAEDFQAVIGSVQKKQASVLNAIAERDKYFTVYVGSVKKAEDLYDLAEKYSQANNNGSAGQAEKAKLKLDEAFSQASGQLFAKLREAKGYSYQKATLAEATGKRFSSQLDAYNASKQIYTHELKMSMLEESLEKIRKYIVVAESDNQVTIIDLQEKLVPNLYDIEPVK